MLHCQSVGFRMTSQTTKCVLSTCGLGMCCRFQLFIPATLRDTTSSALTEMARVHDNAALQRGAESCTHAPGQWETLPSAQETVAAPDKCALSLASASDPVGAILKCSKQQFAA